MDDQELQRRLHDLRDRWRVAPEPPLDAMWDRVRAEAFGSPVRRGPWIWVRRTLPLAAMLALGFGAGRLTTSGAAPAVAVTDSTLHAEQALFVGVADDYLERVTGLLVTLAAEARQGGGGAARSIEYSTSQARDLLATTRLLMDSPRMKDPHLRSLLDDLELVLTQVARLPARPSAPDVYLIDQALDQRDVLPRLRDLMAESASSRGTTE